MIDEESKPSNPIDTDEAMHYWFGLSYANFLTVPRVVIQSMPPEWQRKMYLLLKEMDETFDWKPGNFQYCVQARDLNGRLCPLPADMCDYQRGRARLEPRNK